ncbi:Tyrosine aminotransferase [Planctomycetes bacterium Poly30]|uniref:Tyrosine aminotransferase n=1 Tax=Saltatorellus ferox TaxID=2528018 RepID=A0A518EXR7_9BACT|nr:Tyrosine aminotransferase [Planctomycetes bacterium Poly30]
MEILISEARGRPGDDPIFTINSQANARRAAGERVVNASLGALLDDDGKLAVMDTVTGAFRSVPPERGAAYAPIAGDRAYLDAVIDDALGGSTLKDCAVAVATPGGTGALVNAVMNFLEPGQALYTSSYFWSPYKIIASHNLRRVATFPMFTADGKFNVEGFESGLVELLAKQGRALVILNFPCHNPTGYTLDEGEWEGVVAALGRCADKGPIALLVDLAYAHFGQQDRSLWARKLEPIASKVTILAAWTASKSFAQYGARVGALIAAVPDEAARTQVANAMSFSCRGSWSNCNHAGLLAITSLLTDADLARSTDQERDALVGLLNERVEAFNRAARAKGLRYPRYEGGFFVSVFTPDAKRTAEVAAEAGVFVVPMDGAVRIALCSVAEKDIDFLVEHVARGVEAAGGQAANAVGRVSGRAGV